MLNLELKITDQIAKYFDDQIFISNIITYIEDSKINQLNKLENETNLNYNIFTPNIYENFKDSVLIDYKNSGLKEIIKCKLDKNKKYKIYADKSYITFRLTINDINVKITCNYIQYLIFDKIINFKNKYTATNPNSKNIVKLLKKQYTTLSNEIIENEFMKIKLSNLLEENDNKLKFSSKLNDTYDISEIDLNIFFKTNDDILKNFI